jgi:integrase
MKRPKSFKLKEVLIRPVRPPGKRSPLWYWRATYWQDAREHTLWTGRASRADVSRAVMALLVDGIPQPMPEKSAETVRELLSLYLGSRLDRADLASSTRAANKNAAQRLNSVIGDRLIARLDVDDLAEYRDIRLRGDAASATVGHDLGFIRAAWKWGRGQGDCPDRTLPRPSLTVRPKRDKHTPNRLDVAAVYGALPEGWIRLAYLLLAGTGCRVQEALDLRWEDVDLGAREARMTGKTGPRLVPLGGDLLAALRAAERPGGSVIHPPRTRGAVHHQIRETCKQIGVRHFSPHGLRRFVEDELAEQGVDIAVYADLLGHSPIVALKHYRRSTSASRARAAALAGLGTIGAVVIPLKRRGRS